MSPTIIDLPLDYFPALLALPIILILSVIFLKSEKKKELDGPKLPPSPPRLPVIGNLHQLGKLPHRSLWKLSRKYGPVMLLRLGDVPTLVVSSAEMAREVLKVHDLDTCSRPPSPGARKLSYNYLDIIFSPCTDYWRKIRKLFTFELLSTKREHLFWLVREAKVEALISFLRENSGKAVEMDERIFALMDGIVGTVAFGKMYGSERFQDKSFQCVLVEVMNMLASFSAEDFFPSWGGSFDKLRGQSARLEKIFHNLDKYFQMVIEEHQNPSRPKQESEDFVDVLLSLQKDPKDRQLTLTNDHIKAILLDTFIGANTTSIITVLWTMSELMKNPRVLKKVQYETRSRVSKKARVRPDDMVNLSYLKMVVKETLRLHPPATLLVPRETVRPCKIGCYDVPERTRVFVNVWGIGRDPRRWENPDEFNPDRFEGAKVDFNGQNFELLPFGGGRRMCPGLMMGLSTVEFTLANLLYCFDWKLPGGVKMGDFSMEEESGGLTTHRKMPLRLVPIKYN